MLHELGERELEEYLRRLAEGAMSMGASDISALTLLARDISNPTRGR